MTFESLMAFAGIVFLIAVIPGPNALLVMFTALAKNRLMAFANVAGVALGFIVHACISALGLSLLIAQSSMAFMALKWIGVIYLLWLGWSNLKAGLNLKLLNMPENKPINSLTNNFVKGLLTNLLNPKIVLFYLSIFPQFVSQKAVFTESLLLGFTQAIVVSSWFLVVILLARNFKEFLTNAKRTRWLNFISGGVFIAFSAKLATAKL
ncbi:homoserine lactone transporter [Pseudoalteromonas sp. NBT06-2]|uniref:LysE family translocator n=1 Tax=Pseudoalteromonas sp. NBT06-2 TaxID=2025950 RepID=UPI000BA5D876|nr:LysE family translocator [Pseudoalteromonas sp. NBT06-2]PAJ75431.1 homoserine lactone transporter [Pseudoalteromonas sp. NBT06-2]